MTKKSLLATVGIRFLCKDPRPDWFLRPGGMCYVLVFGNKEIEIFMKVTQSHCLNFHENPDFDHNISANS